MCVMTLTQKSQNPSIPTESTKQELSTNQVDTLGKEVETKVGRPQ